MLKFAVFVTLSLSVHCVSELTYDHSFCPRVEVKLYRTECISCESNSGLCHHETDGLLSIKAMCFDPSNQELSNGANGIKPQCQQICEKPKFSSLEEEGRNCSFTPSYHCEGERCEFEIVCNPNYAEEPIVCDCRKDIMESAVECRLHDVCSKDNGDCDERSTTCVNTGFGSKTCECKLGFKREDIDPIKDIRCGYKDFTLTRYLHSDSPSNTVLSLWFYTFLRFIVILLNSLT